MNRAPLNSGPINGSPRARVPDDGPQRLEAFDGETLWLLDLEVAGHPFRFATEAVDVERADGTVVRYEEGLADPSVAFGQTMGSDASVSVQVDSGTDWARLVADGHSLDRRSATLRRWSPGTVLEAARVVLRGRTHGAEYGAPEDGLTVAVKRARREQTRTFPPPQWVVDATTWLDGIPSSAEGLSYPVVIGCPGHTEDGPVPVVPIPQAYWEMDALSWAIWVGGHAAQIRLRVESELVPDVVEVDWSPQTTYDALGQQVEAVIQSAPLLTFGATVAGGVHPVDDGGAPVTDEFVVSVVPGRGDGRDRFYAGFADTDDYGGGILGPRGDLLRGAGDVVEWVLAEYFDGPVDRARVAAVRGYLNRWKIDTWIDEPPESLFDWLTSEILPLLPVELREGTEGVYPALVRYDLTEADVVAHLDADAGEVERVSAITVEDADVANEITVRFRPGRDGGWLGTRILAAQPRVLSGVRVTRTPGEDVRVLGSPLCAASQRRYAVDGDDGVRPLEVEAWAVWDATTAVLVAEHLAARQAWSRRSVQYEGGPHLERLEVGQAVTVTDAEVHLDRQVALVVDVTPGPASVTLDLLLLDAP